MVSKSRIVAMSGVAIAVGGGMLRAVCGIGGCWRASEGDRKTR